MLSSLVLLAGCSSTPVRPAAAPIVKPSGSERNALVPEPTGPTLFLDDTHGDSRGSPISDFMYFVPLISPDPVAVTESPANTQRARILSATRRFGEDSFTAVCEFEITGEGFQRNAFDPTNQIRRNERRLKEGGALERQLGNITITGSGRGRIDVEGVTSNQTKVVTEVRLRFNDHGQPSPVTIGLEDIRFVDGAIRADNEVVARVNTLTFRRTAGRPKMEVTVGSVKRKGAGDGLWQRFVGGVTGMAANLFLKPVTVDKLGHETMLNFGRALAFEESSFTFPRAKNLKNLGSSGPPRTTNLSPK